MDKLRKIRTLEQWDYEATVGLVKEPPYQDFTHKTNIICTISYDNNGGICGAFLMDLPFILQEIIEPRRAITCQKCGWFGSRKIAKIKCGT